MNKKRLAIFVSGTGSNALNIIDHFKDHLQIEVGFVLSNKKDSPVIEACAARNVSVHVFTNSEVADGSLLLDVCLREKIDYIVLAGYLRLIPLDFIHVYNEKIFNIHPSLLPKFGGHGMYGDRVHQAVLEANEGCSGISIHLVNEHFDEGRILAQFSCLVKDGDTISDLKKRIQKLEHAYFPVVIEKTITLENND